MSSEILDIDTLHKISRRDWSKLRDLYRRNWPKRILSFNTLRTFTEWVTENPSHDMTMYTTDENWKQHGTFLLVETNGIRCNVHFNTINASKTSDLMMNALKTLHNDGVYTLAAYGHQIKPTVDQVLYNLGLTDFENDVYDTILYYLPQKESLKLAIQPKVGYRFRPLNIDDVPLIDSVWPHQYPGSDKYIGDIVCHNLTLGAYEEQTEKLCGWVMQEHIGTIALLQVMDSYKREGLGEHLVRQMAVLMANAGMDATATVSIMNRPSRHLFQKLGFKIIDRVYWYNKNPRQEPEPIKELTEANISQLLLEVDCN